MRLPRSQLIQFSCVLLLLATVFISTGCPQKNLDKKKAAVYDIQKTVDLSADTLVFVQANNLAPPSVVKDFATGMRDINRANKVLINAAWASDASLPEKLEALKGILSTFLNSGSVRGVLPAQLKEIVDKLSRAYATLKGG